MQRHIPPGDTNFSAGHQTPNEPPRLRCRYTNRGVLTDRTSDSRGQIGDLPVCGWFISGDPSERQGAKGEPNVAEGDISVFGLRPKVGDDSRKPCAHDIAAPPWLGGDEHSCGDFDQPNALHERVTLDRKLFHNIVGQIPVPIPEFVGEFVEPSDDRGCDKAGVQELVRIPFPLRSMIYFVHSEPPSANRGAVTPAGPKHSPLRFTVTSGTQ